MSNITMLRIPLFFIQLFADGGTGGDGGTGTGEGTGAEAVVNAPDDGENRLRALGVPEEKLAKRAERIKKSGNKPAMNAPKASTAGENAAAMPKEEANKRTDVVTNPDNAPAKMSWEDIMSDPEYNKKMQETVQSRLKTAKAAEENLSKLAPAIELLTRKYGMDAKNLDYDALAKNISDDDSYYEDKALEMGVDVDTAKRLDQSERENIRRKQEEAQTIEQQKIQDHIQKLQQQGEELKKMFPSFDLRTELQNPAFMRMTSPNVGVSVEDAYYAVHRKEIQAASAQIMAQKTAEKISNSIQSGMSRPVENGTSSIAPSVTSFDPKRMSKEQRESLRRRIHNGEKILPGQEFR